MRSDVVPTLQTVKLHVCRYVWLVNIACFYFVSMHYFTQIFCSFSFIRASLFVTYLLSRINASGSPSEAAPGRKIMCNDKIIFMEFQR